MLFAGCLGINVASVCIGAVTLNTLPWTLLCLYNLCTDTFVMNYPLGVQSANTFPSIIPIQTLHQPVAASKFLHRGTEHERKKLL